MPVQPQPLPIQFTGGIETKADAKGVPTTKLLDLQNAVFTKATTLSKRNGYRALSTLIDTTGMDIGVPDGIATRGAELVAFSGGRAYSHRPSVDRWADTGDVHSVIARCTPVARTGTQQVMPCAAVRNGIMVVAWEDSRGGIRCSVIEDATGRVVLPDFELDANGQRPRCVAVGEVIHVLYVVPTSGRIYVAIVNPADPSAEPVPTILTDDLSTTNPSYDAQTGGPNAYPDILPGIIAWVTAAGFRFAYLHPAGVLGSPVTGLPAAVSFADTVTGAIGVCIDRGSATDGAIGIVWVANPHTVLSACILEAASLVIARGPVNIGAGSNGYQRVACEFGPVGIDGLPLLYWAADDDTQTDVSAVEGGYLVQTDNSHDGASSRLRGHVLVTRAFRDGPNVNPSGVGDDDMDGHVYVGVAHAVQFFPYVAVVRLSADGFGGEETIAVARLIPGDAVAHYRRTSPTEQEQVPHLSAIIDDVATDGDAYARVHRMPLSYRIQLDSEDGDQFSEVGIMMTSLDFDSDVAYQTAEYGRGLYLAGAGPQHYDGNRWVEAGYHTAPDFGYGDTGNAIDPSGAFSQGGASGLANGEYLYKIWYEDVDDQGELHVGPVSSGILFTVTGGPRQVTIELPTYRLTKKRNVRICVARSKVNATSNGDEAAIPLYRVTSTDPGASGDNGFVLNDASVDSVTFVDALDDSELGKREPLYTNGGPLSNDPAPWAGDVIASGKGRLFWNDPKDPDLVRYSKASKDDTAIEAPIDFSLRVDPSGGRITGIGMLDDAVVVFKETAVFRFTGPGPLDDPDVDPQANSFAPPAPVPCDVGCTEPTSIGETPVGLIFKSTKGIALVTRDLQLSRIGNPVDGYNAQRVTRTTALPDRPQIIMLADSGRTLLFDYERGQWSTFTNHEGYDACVVDGVYHYLRTDGRVFAETVGEYRDDNRHIPMLIETAWVKMSGYLQGWQRVLWAYFLGAYKSAHTLRVRFRLDYRDAWSAPFDLDVNSNFNPSVYGGGPYGDGPYGGAADASSVYQRRIHLNQRCQSIQFRIEDVEDTDDFGAAFELSELLLIGGVLGPAFKPGAARSS